jgi:hypothetical protein
MKTVPPRREPAGLKGWLFGTPDRPKAPPEKQDPAAAVLLEMIGREHSGKSALRTCYYKGPLAGPQPSGLELAAADPPVMTRWMVDALETYRDLRGRGLVSTPITSPARPSCRRATATGSTSARHATTASASSTS